MEVCNLPNKIMCSDSNCWLSKPCRLASDCMIRIYESVVSEFMCKCDNSTIVRPICEQTKNIENKLDYSVENATEQIVIDNIGYIILSISILLVIISIYYREFLRKYVCCFCKKNMTVVNRQESNDQV